MTLLIKAKSGETVEVPLQHATDQCALFGELRDELFDEALESNAVEIDVPCELPAVEAVATFIRCGTAHPTPLDGQRWADGEVCATHMSFLESIFGQGVPFENGGIDRYIDAMRAADFMRHERALSMLANFLAQRLADSTPREVKGWCGPSAPLSADEQNAVTSMHRLLLEQKM